jgi:hypothetical protein
MSGNAEVKFHIDESKITVYRYADRMRDQTVRQLESRLMTPGLPGDQITEITEAIDWLKKLTAQPGE